MLQYSFNGKLLSNIWTYDISFYNTSRSAPARTAPRRSQFFMFPCFKVATLKLTFAIWLPSKLAFLKFTPIEKWGINVWIEWNRFFEKSHDKNLSFFTNLPWWPLYHLSHQNDNFSTKLSQGLHKSFWPPLKWRYLRLLRTNQLVLDYTLTNWLLSRYILAY